MSAAKPQLTNHDEELFRQVAPKDYRVGNVVTSVTFRPLPKDEGYLSVDRSSLTTAENSFLQFVNGIGNSVGVLAVTVGECANEQLNSYEDPLPNNGWHALVDFNGLTRGQQETKAKLLRDIAEKRGYRHGPLPPG
jgi:hypothetical protein